MKKVIKRVVFIALAVLCIVFVVLRIRRTVKHIEYGVGWYCADFQSNRKEFKIIANRAISLYEEAKEKNNEVRFMFIDGLDNGAWVLEFCGEDAENDNYYLKADLTEEERNAYKCVLNAFAGSESECLYGIKVTDDRVAFMATLGYEVVFMRNGKRPKSVGPYHEPEECFVNMIWFRWYEIVWK